jgi:putative peptide maturation dehydrogenase
VEAEGFDERVIRRLLDKALVVSDDRSAVATEVRERDEALTANAWHPYAALYHFATQWTGVTIEDTGDREFAAETAAAVHELVAAHGAPPSELPHIASAHTVSLPGRTRREPFYRTLVARRTTRAFESELPMAIDDFDTILRYVFGCHGYAGTPSGVVSIKRTSASGGGLHPITPYPIVSNVEGVAAGVYHYNASDHSMALLEHLTEDEARALAATAMCGQGYFAGAHVSFVLAARFYRNHWKYRRHPRAYAGILMDAAHLSQTLYLVAAELGLGAFVTIGINGRDIETRLGLDGVEEGVIAICGCGPRCAAGSPLEPQFTAQRPVAD